MSTADFIERRRSVDWQCANDALRDASEELHRRGATWLRAHFRETVGEIIVEGWRVRPALGAEGDLPL